MARNGSGQLWYIRDNSSDRSVRDRAWSQVVERTVREVAPQITLQVVAVMVRILHAAITSPMEREERQEAAALKDRKHLRGAYLEPLVRAGWPEVTIAHKPDIRLQRYRLTPQARLGWTVSLPFPNPNDAHHT